MFNHGCIKPGFTTDDYLIDKPLNIYLKLHVFEHNAWSAFCHVLRMSVAYKLGQNDFDTIFSLVQCWKVIMCNLPTKFLMKIFSKSFVEIMMLTTYLSIVTFFRQL